ncbi:MAG: histidine phosphatase family protein [Mariprofundaceae bacterium]|nr:histidine phosphatase family protein [Mariprofundaceae bacterium]
MIVDLLRHGALQGGVKYRGRVEGYLTTEGRDAMNRVWQHIANDVDVIISSPLKRCLEPAQAWAKEKGIVCISDERMAEMHYGDWEDKTHAEIECDYPGMLALWRVDPTGMRPPKGESPEELRIRIADFWQDICATYAKQHVLVVGHSGSTRMLIAHIEGKPIAYTRDISMPYACWSRAEYHGDTSQMVFIDG